MIISRSVYTQIQTRVKTIISTVVFFEKLKCFHFFATVQGQCFLSMSFLPPWATEKSEWQYWEYAEDLETKDSITPGSDLYLDRNICSLTALALSPSVLFRFILFSVKVIGKQFQHGLQKNGEHLYFKTEVQASLSTA